MKLPRWEGHRAAQRWFWWGRGFEASLGGAALLLASLLHEAPFGTFRVTAPAALSGGLAILPLLGLYCWIALSPWPPWRRIRRFLEDVVRPVLAEWTLLQLFILSLLAGISEELLFRGLIQGGLERRMGWFAGCLVASALFGACHAITPAYSVAAALIGAYLGLVWSWSDNLLTPMVAHAGYDLIALILLTRRGGFHR